MSFRIAGESREALQRNRTIRLLYMNHLHCSCRCSEVVLAWAQRRVMRFCCEFVRESAVPAVPAEGSKGDGSRGEGKGEGEGDDEGDDKGGDNSNDESNSNSSLGLGTPSSDGHNSSAVDFDVKIHMVHLLSQRDSFVLFDLFLADCHSQVRERVQQSFEEPIHRVLNRFKTFHVFRDRMLDLETGHVFWCGRVVDRGPRPLFADTLNPPEYNNGFRVEEKKSCILSRAREERRRGEGKVEGVRAGDRSGDDRGRGQGESTGNGTEGGIISDDKRDGADDNTNNDQNDSEMTEEEKQYAQQYKEAQLRRVQIYGAATPPMSDDEESSDETMEEEA